MTLLASYVDAWAAHDIDGVLATLADDCVVTESYGPVYRGRDRVAQWMRTWLERGGAIRSWQITRDLSPAGAFQPAVEVAECVFSCVWAGETATFDGVSIAIVERARIRELREYATTAPLYEWTGHWRDDAGV